MLIHPGSEDTNHPLPENVTKISSTESNGPRDIPAALISDVEHAFVCSSNRKIVAIDRYRIQHQTYPVKLKDAN